MKNNKAVLGLFSILLIIIILAVGFFVLKDDEESSNNPEEFKYTNLESAEEIDSFLEKVNKNADGFAGIIKFKYTGVSDETVISTDRINRIIYVEAIDFNDSNNVLYIYQNGEGRFIGGDELEFALFAHDDETKSSFDEEISGDLISVDSSNYEYKGIVDCPNDSSIKCYELYDMTHENTDFF
ncbi:MAG: hypothetical protein Q9M91_03175 [Candidatus Dojkabacteria bacterium]|nr:hypothetical protein [Candidatus Dojkabacteria bacterium]MDQ7020825.1 hypothetical protein [Candidatus Dojkabacteria bacterium]